MKQVKIGFLGAGKMAEAILSRLISSGQYRASEIGVTARTAGRLTLLKRKYKVLPFKDNRSLVKASPLVILAVKPQIMPEVLDEIHPLLQNKNNRLFISIAAGKEIRFFRNKLSPRLKIVRTMPNNPALVGSGTTGLFAPPGLSTKDRRLAERIMRAIGQTVWVKKESDLDTVTALSGSGPAYFYTLFETMIETGKKLGLTEQLAKELACTTAIGAARMVLETGEKPLLLRDWVTSKKGTTEAALKVLARNHFAETFEKALYAAVYRARELRKG